MGRDASGNVQREFYRAKAEKCVEHAAASNDPLMRVTWLEMAAMWAKLIPQERSRDHDVFDQSAVNTWADEGGSAPERKPSA